MCELGIYEYIAIGWAIIGNCIVVGLICYNAGRKKDNISPEQARENYKKTWDRLQRL